LKLPRPLGTATLLLLIALGLVSEPCSAETPARALLLLPTCPLEGISEQELRAALALELQADGLTLAAPGDGFGRSDALLEIDSTCQPNAELSLRVLFQDKERSRTLSLAELPPGTRSRMLALSLAELIDRLEPEPPAPAAPAPMAEESAPPESPEPAAPPPESSAPPPAETPASEAREPAPVPPEIDAPEEPTPSGQRLALVLAPELRWFSSGDALFGGRLGLDTTRVFAGAGLLIGGSSSDVGDVDALLLQGFAGYRLIDRELGSGFSTSFGPRAGLGWIEVTGSSGDNDVAATSAGTLYLDAAVFGDVRLVLSRQFRFSLGVEGGVSRGLVALADGATAASYDGVFIAGFLGLMLSP
jgi:hypothetical protein